jgi:hypothetical protein
MLDHEREESVYQRKKTSKGQYTKSLLYQDQSRRECQDISDPMHHSMPSKRTKSQTLPLRLQLPSGMAVSLVARTDVDPLLLDQEHHLLFHKEGVRMDMILEEGILL